MEEPRRRPTQIQRNTHRKPIPTTNRLGNRSTIKQGANQSAEDETRKQIEQTHPQSPAESQIAAGTGGRGEKVTSPLGINQIKPRSSEERNQTNRGTARPRDQLATDQLTVRKRRQAEAGGDIRLPCRLVWLCVP